MSFEGSYLWGLRQKVGHDLVLVPGAAIAVQRADGKVLLVRRGDNGVWALPGGGAEIGGSFPCACFGTSLVSSSHRRN